MVLLDIPQTFLILSILLFVASYILTVLGRNNAKSDVPEIKKRNFSILIKLSFIASIVALLLSLICEIPKRWKYSTSKLADTANIVAVLLSIGLLFRCRYKGDDLGSLVAMLIAVLSAYVLEF